MRRCKYCSGQWFLFKNYIQGTFSSKKSCVKGLWSKIELESVKDYSTSLFYKHANGGGISFVLWWCLWFLQLGFITHSICLTLTTFLVSPHYTSHLVNAEAEVDVNVFVAWNKYYNFFLISATYITFFVFSFEQRSLCNVPWTCFKVCFQIILTQFWKSLLSTYVFLNNL